MQILSICLSELPKEAIRLGKDGRKYIGLCVVPLKQKDNYDNDLTVFVNQTKEQREAKEAKKYVGKGRTYSFHENVQDMPHASDVDDLPF